MDLTARFSRPSSLNRLTQCTLGTANRLRFPARPGLLSTSRSLSTDAPEGQNHSREPVSFHLRPQPALLQEPKSLRPTPPSFHKNTRHPTNLPLSCPGCGALTQDVDPGEAGFYTTSRRAVRSYLRSQEHAHQGTWGGDSGAEDIPIPPQSITGMEDVQQQDAGHSKSEIPTPLTPPVCDRCHYLIHDSRGVPIAHPSVEAIADSIAESPFNRNHVYHVVDAADFPMSLIPSIFKNLDLAKPRTQNRRSQHSFSSKPSLSFIITRSDLLAPTKEMVDSLMPRFTSILRTALGRPGRKIRLGNVHLVSSKRGWWTKDIKDSIWKRGGGNWLVGKFNVGKSNLFEVLFPKGSNERAPVYEELLREQQIESNGASRNADFFSEKSLLPPPQPEVPFPPMPLVSSLPGTTASPIRLPFGNRRGELIDMPGLERGGLDQYVKLDEKNTLVMTHRPTVTQHNIKPGQSLLLGGGLIRITPILDENDRSTIMMAYPFLPLKAHVTLTDKAIGAQLQLRESGIESVLSEDAGSVMSSAGRFKLQTDVTKSRAGSMVRAGVPVAKLPFQVYATDILIESVGWVELVCQVRKNKRTPGAAGSEDRPLVPESAGPAVPKDEALSFQTKEFTSFGTFSPASNPEQSEFPEVEIFTPNGKFVGQRPCLDVWQAWSSGKARDLTRGARPRKPMSGAKKREKLAFRAVSHGLA